MINWKKFIFGEERIIEPINYFSEYIGQEIVKERLHRFIEGSKLRSLLLPHFLITGAAGMGKTTLALATAKILRIKYGIIISRRLNDSTTSEIYDIISDIKGGILIIDEIHSLKRSVAEVLYPLLDSQTFTLIGCTTEHGELIKKMYPLYTRFMPLELSAYTIADMIIMCDLYKRKLYSNEYIPEKLYSIISKNCRLCPRILLLYLKAIVYYQGDYIKVLDSFDIIKDGYTHKDLKILEYILEHKSGCGLNNIASFVGTSSENYLYHIEPYLLQNNLIIRCSTGRKITEDGKRKIQELK